MMPWRAPDQILRKMCQNPCKLCKKWSSKMEAFNGWNSGAPSTWSKLRSGSVLDLEHGLCLDHAPHGRNFIWISLDIATKKGPWSIFEEKCQNPCKLCKKWSSKMEAFKLGSSGAPSTWSKLRSRSVLDPEHGIYLDQSGKIRSRSCLCLEKRADLNQDPPLDDPGRSFDLEQSSIWNMAFVWIMLHMEGVLSG